MKKIPFIISLLLAVALNVLAQGQSASDPFKPTDLATFRAAFINESIKYIEIEDLKIMAHDAQQLDVVSVINQTKVLTLKGHNVITAPSTSHIAGIFMVMSNGSLIIEGDGQLAFEAVLNGAHNAIIWNSGGTVVINSGTLLGYINTAVYGRAIYNLDGDLTINGGTFIANNYFEHLNSGFAPLSVSKGNIQINGGNFIMNNHVSTQYKPSALYVDSPTSMTIQGGSFSSYGNLTQSIISKNVNISELIDNGVTIYEANTYNVINDLAVKEITPNIILNDIPGMTADKPFLVTNFAQLKLALESDNILYIEIDKSFTEEVLIPGSSNEVMIYVSGASGRKDLNIKENVSLRADESGATVLSLMLLNKNAALTIRGEGTLHFMAKARNMQNAVIWNQGYLQVLGGVIKGDFFGNDGQLNGIAIRNEGSLDVSGGTLIGASSADYVTHSAVSLIAGDAFISGGSFEMYAPNGGDHVALLANDTVNLELSGGSFAVYQKEEEFLTNSNAIAIETDTGLSYDFWAFLTHGFIVVDANGEELKANTPYLNNIRIITEPVTTLRQRWLRDNSTDWRLLAPRYRLNGQKAH